MEIQIGSFVHNSCSHFLFSLFLSVFFFYVPCVVVRAVSVFVLLYNTSEIHCNHQDYACKLKLIWNLKKKDTFLSLNFIVVYILSCVFSFFFFFLLNSTFVSLYILNASSVLIKLVTVIFSFLLSLSSFFVSINSDRTSMVLKGKLYETIELNSEQQKIPSKIIQSLNERAKPASHWK